MKRPSPGRSPPLARLAGMLLMAAVAFAVGMTYGQRRPVGGFSSAALQAAGSSPAAAAAARGRSALEGGGDLRTVAREALENEAAKGGGAESLVVEEEEAAGAEALAQAEAAKVAAAEERRKAEEAAAAAAGEQRQAEAARKAAEEERKQAEAARKAAEEERKQAEAAKAAAEGERKQAQAAKAAAEEERKRLEAARAAAESSSSSSSSPKLAGRIPKILHHIFVPSSSAADKDVKMWPHHERWVHTCRLHHSKEAGWEYRLWGAAESEKLIGEHYPWFLDFYRANVTLANEKTDLLRYIILHKYGGLYLDSDVDCWRESGDMLEGYDVVLQGSHPAEGSGSASIAARPGLPVFLKALELVQDPQRNVVQGTMRELGDAFKSIHRTGPDLLADSLVTLGIRREANGLFKEEYIVDGVVYHVHPAGTWFLPCQWWERGCRRRLYQELAIGQVDLTRLVGQHRFAGSWIPGKEDGAGIVNVTEEICFPKNDFEDKKRRRRRLLGDGAASTGYRGMPVY